MIRSSILTDDEIVPYFGMGKADNVGELISKMSDINSPKLPIVLNIYDKNHEIQSYRGDIGFMVDVDSDGKLALFLLGESRDIIDTEGG
jgi:hypothetical protein